MKKKLIVSINQPAYLPWLGYFDRITKSDLHIVLDHVQFEKNSVVNRNKIKTPQGSLWLTVPVKTKGKFGRNPINELLIDNQTDWRKKHFKSLCQNYTKARHFQLFEPFFKEMYQRGWRKIIDLNMHFIRFVLTHLGIQTPLVFSSSLSPEKTKGELVLELCRRVGATHYISGAFGRNYLDLECFQQNGIEVAFQDFTHPHYEQLYESFKDRLSIADLLFNCGETSSDVLCGSAFSSLSNGGRGE